MATVKPSCPACKHVFLVEVAAGAQPIACPRCGARLMLPGTAAGATNWYYARAGQKVGPLSFVQLKRLADQGQLGPADMLWQEGAPRWAEARTLPGLFATSPRAARRPQAPRAARAPARPPVPSAARSRIPPPRRAGWLWPALALGVLLLGGLGVVALAVNAWRRPSEGPLQAAVDPPIPVKPEAGPDPRQDERPVQPEQKEKVVSPPDQPEPEPVWEPIGPPTIVATAVPPPPPPKPREGTIQTFSLREAFGVAHPKQIVLLPCTEKIDPARTALVGSDGAAVPYQLLRDGKIAIQTDLPANSQRTWKVVAGQAPASAAGGVKVVEGKSYYEITNEKTGVRVPVAKKGDKQTRAPIQGLRFRDGTWTATGLNYLHSRSWYEAPLAPPPAKEMTVKFLERGPLKVVVEVTYRFDRPDFVYGQKLLVAGGDGFHRTTIELQADQPSVLVEEEGDMDLGYSLDLYPELKPDQARYRGHHASSAERGREPDGAQYRHTNERGGLDALIDLKYDKLTKVSYSTNEGLRPRLAVWDPWIFDSGWYWQLYNSQAGAAGNLFGIFAGPASRAIGANACGAGVFNGPGADGSPSAGITVELNRSDPSFQISPHNRFAWGIFVGVKGKDLLPAEQVQPIGQQMNLHSGFNLNKLLRCRLDFVDPPAGYGALYMEREALDRLVRRVREDRGYFNYLYEAESTSRPLIDLWREGTGKPLKEVTDRINQLARELVEALVHGDGIYDFRFHYWHGGTEMMRMGLWIDQALAVGRLAPEERARVKAAAALFAHMLWDDDFVPFQADEKDTLAHGLNLGTGNMPVQHQNYRDFYALFLGADPAWRGRAADVRRRVVAALHNVVNEHGAATGSTGYLAASLAPILNTLLQLRMLEGEDLFKTEPRLTRLAEFLLNLLTPPEPRFGNLRKVVSVGDGSTQASPLHGVLATGFRTANPDLSARLMGAWHAQGKPHSGFFGTTLLTINEQAPTKDPALASSHFPGYYSVLRSGWGGLKEAAPKETALWFFNGDFYSDHRRADQGSVAMYALGAPLSLNWGGMYYPQTASPFLHSAVLPEAHLGRPWDQDDPPLNANAVWGSSTPEAFLSFRAGSYSRARFATGGTTWVRSVCAVHADEDRPILVIRDRFTGDGADAAKVFSLNLMADGAVDTPAGKVTPPARSHKDGQLPSAGQAFALPAGANRLGFTGQGLIDFDVYTLSAREQQAAIGNWAHGWHPILEMAEFRRATGSEFEERQHILRLRGDGPFQVLILPYRKGPKRVPVEVKRQGDSAVVRSGNQTVTLAEDFYAYQDGKKQVLAALGDRAEAGELVVAGGSAEVVVEPQRATVTAHGAKGQRRLKFPGKWKVNDPRLRFESGEWLLDYAGGSPLTVTLLRE